MTLSSHKRARNSVVQQSPAALDGPRLDDRATQALRSAAAELGAGHPEMLAQKIFHRQFVAPSRGRKRVHSR
jgi:hypothetical protein